MKFKYMGKIECNARVYKASSWKTFVYDSKIKIINNIAPVLALTVHVEFTC